MFHQPERHKIQSVNVKLETNALPALLAMPAMPIASKTKVIPTSLKSTAMTNKLA